MDRQTDSPQTAEETNQTEAGSGTTYKQTGKLMDRHTSKSTRRPCRQADGQHTLFVLINIYTGTSDLAYI